METSASRTTLDASLRALSGWPWRRWYLSYVLHDQIAPDCSGFFSFGGGDILLDSPTGRRCSLIPPSTVVIRLGSPPCYSVISWCVAG